VDVVTEWTLLLRVLTAAGLSAIIGFEREVHGRPAGLRTHVLVGIGAALVMAGGEAVVQLVAARIGVQVDPGRIAAGVITGIGFLGAGTIIRVGDWIRGLTTAASIWYVAALGIVAGQGLYVLAVGGALIGVAVLTLLDRVEERIPSAIYHGLVLDVTPDKRIAVQQAIVDLCKRERIRVQLRGWASTGSEGMITLRFMVRRRGSIDIGDLGSQIGSLPGVSQLSLE
jgi:putative Mg2+ transporter-C (MgtC) family protein